MQMRTTNIIPSVNKYLCTTSCWLLVVPLVSGLWALVRAGTTQDFLIWLPVAATLFGMASLAWLAWLKLCNPDTCQRFAMLIWCLKWGVIGGGFIIIEYIVGNGSLQGGRGAVVPGVYGMITARLITLAQQKGCLIPSALELLCGVPVTVTGEICNWAVNLEQQCIEWREDRERICAEEEDQGYQICTDEADQGYSECSRYEDQGYKQCCDWAPCSWFCESWVWISNMVCVAWTWVSNIVCVAWTWVSHMVCVAWTWIVSWTCTAFTWVVTGLTCWVEEEE